MDLSAETAKNVAMLTAIAVDMARRIAIMSDALGAAEIAVEELCLGQDPANECWVTLAAIKESRQ